MPGVKPSEQQGLRDATLIGEAEDQEENQVRSPDSRSVLIPRELGKVEGLVMEVMGEH